MRWFNRLVAVAALAVTVACVGVLAQTPSYNSVGRTPTQEEIRAWDISVGPAGKELPPGSGTAKEGAAIYTRKCAACHGPTLEGGNGGPALVGGQGTLTTLRVQRTIGSYWPFATTIWDYINRAMPTTQRGSLSANEVYALTAFLLYKNGIIQENDAMDAKSLPEVRMPNRNNFVPLWPEWKKDAKRPHGIYP
jgi:cytochrome c